MAEILLEPRVGGRWYERGVDGSECDWGRVLAWEPPGRVVFTWQISGAWQFDPDPDHASEIEVLFVEDGPEDTPISGVRDLVLRASFGDSVSDRALFTNTWILLKDWANGTLHEVEHRYFERLDGGQAIHDAIRGGGSWTLLLESYAKTAANAG